jgi:hypothetical protein
MANVGEIRATLTLESTAFQTALQNARNQLALTATAAQAADQAIDSIGNGSIISATQLASLNALQAQLGQTTTSATATNLALSNINNTQIIGPNVTQNITNVNNGLNNTSTQANRARESMKKLHNVALGMSAAVGVAFAASIATAANFEQKMKDVEAVAGATGSEMQQLGNLAKEMGEKTSFGASDAAMGIEELIKAGLTVTQVLDGGLQGALDLATAGGLGLAEAAEIASTALNSFRDDNLKVVDAANILAGASNASATDVNGLRMGLSAVSAVAAGVGLSFKDTTTALASFAQNGLKGSDAGKEIAA